MADMLDMLRQYNNPQPQNDELRKGMALASLTDAWTGSRFTPAFQALAQQQEDPLDQLRKIATLQQYAKQNELAEKRIALEEKKLAQLGRQGLGQLGFKDQMNIIKDIGKTDDYKKARSLAELRQSVDQYEKLVREKGITAFGEESKPLKSAYADLKLKYKEAAKLGALTGPDVGLIEEGIAPATGIKGLIGIGVGGGQEGVIQGINQIKKSLSQDFDIAETSLTGLYGDIGVQKLKSFKDIVKASKENKKKDGDRSAREAAIFKKLESLK